MDIQNRSLLLVDDVPTNLKVLFNYLKQCGFKVRIANSGTKALEQVQRLPPDLILLDVMMPDMNGFDVCRQLKADPKTQDIPVIFMTAKTESVDKVQGFDVGAVDYVTKPIQQDEVLARITTHLTIRDLQKSLQQRNQDLEAFAHTVAHDIKNPVNAITGYAELLIEDLCDTLDADSLDILKKIYYAGENITNITDALLSLSSINQQQVTMQPLDMGEIVEKVHARLAKVIKDNQAEVMLPTRWPTALGHAPWIAEVWANYMSNGLKYGGQPAHLELGATEQEDDFIQFWIQDNGAGLSIEQQQKLFTPFTRVNQAKIEGHGLGLSIVQKIVTKCEGEVGVESEVGQGSRFYFTLPKKV
ncbi:response regulator [Candidatus Albibeggiatoa sp. nov. NOAA]|uniref:response regulator n=1 Tax=Candidatus Albibeggiatoa sp. nov. NOAA TaxID=3162724 RepID=UPI0032FFBCB8|nr:response regulator [Thiotrichaceae bacterium]